ETFFILPVMDMPPSGEGDQGASADVPVQVFGVGGGRENVGGADGEQGGHLDAVHATECVVRDAGGGLRGERVLGHPGSVGHGVGGGALAFLHVRLVPVDPGGGPDPQVQQLHEVGRRHAGPHLHEI